MTTARSLPMLAAIALALLRSAPAEAADAGDCKDSPAMTRFPGSTIASCSDKADDEVSLPRGNGRPDKKIEGEIHVLSYRAPEGVAKAEIVRNVSTALRTAGFTIDYDSGSWGDYTAHKGRMWIWESVGQGHYDQTIVLPKKLEQLMVADAAALSGGLSANGHIVVNGIYFDTGKATVKPKSAAALKEMAKLLQNDASLKVWVVGHTDNQGTLASNMELSKERAAAVVRALSTEHGVAASRLQPFGDGPYAPVTTNDTDDGRALNRRVELVKQ